MLTRALAVASFFFVLGLPSGLASSILFGTYSSLEFNCEAGDLLGYEVKIFPVATGTVAAIQAADGGAGRASIAVVRVDGDGIEFDIPEEGAIFRGQALTSGLVGEIVYKNDIHRKIEIPRRVSYWDRLPSKCPL